MKRFFLASAVALVGVVAFGLSGRLNARAPKQAGPPASPSSLTSATVTRQDFVRSVRLSGTVEAVQATTITTPRLAGQNNNTLVIMTLVRAGRRCGRAILVEFDRQDQIRTR